MASPVIPVTRKYTAMNVPHGLKRPGVIAVLPRKAAANAGSRNVLPDAGRLRPPSRCTARRPTDGDDAGGHEASPAHASHADTAQPGDVGAPSHEQDATPDRREVEDVPEDDSTGCSP